jgi:hypothetical protein
MYIAPRASPAPPIRRSLGQYTLSPAFISRFTAMNASF